MSKLPSLTEKEVVSLIKKVGFIVERQRGSHVFLKHDDGRQLWFQSIRGRQSVRDFYLKY
jgi:predicted RNA binding protein YcfA (HicA-like mRNA interferase family)